MDKSFLWTGFLCVSTVIAYADDIGRGAKALWRRLRLGAKASDGLGIIALVDLVSDSPERIERGMAILRCDTDPSVTTRLIALLQHANPDVRRRAARLLFERQDPQGLEPLYLYLAQNRAA